MGCSRAAAGPVKPGLHGSSGVCPGRCNMCLAHPGSACRVKLLLPGQCTAGTAPQCWPDLLTSLGTASACPEDAIPAPRLASSSVPQLTMVVHVGSVEDLLGLRLCSCRFLVWRLLLSEKLRALREVVQQAYGISAQGITVKRGYRVSATQRWCCLSMNAFLAAQQNLRDYVTRRSARRATPGCAPRAVSVKMRSAGTAGTPCGDGAGY